MDSLIGSKRMATLLTWLVLTIFCASILFGWWYLLAPTVGQKYVSAAIAFVLTAIAAVCARQIGQYRAEAIINEEHRPWYYGWKPYVFLAVISALGTLNAAFILFESRAILRHDIADVRGAFNHLRDTAHDKLPSPEHEKKAAKVEALLKSLHEEIVSPVGGNYCGVGIAARSIIREIAQLLPTVHDINGAGPIRPCDIPRAELLYASYAKMAHESLDKDQAFVAENGPTRAAFLRTLDTHYAAMDSALGQLEVAAAGVGTTDQLDKNALLSARTTYNADRATFLTLDPRPYPDIKEIGTLQSEDVNSYAATIELFYKRLFYPSTWFYLALALMIDFVVIYLITQLNVRYGKRRKRGTKAPDPAAARFTTDPKFLWLNPTDV